MCSARWNLTRREFRISSDVRTAYLYTYARNPRKLDKDTYRSSAQSPFRRSSPRTTAQWLIAKIEYNNEYNNRLINTRDRDASSAVHLPWRAHLVLLVLSSSSSPRPFTPLYALTKFIVINTNHIQLAPSHHHAHRQNSFVCPASVPDR